MQSNRYKKNRIHKHYMSKSEFKKIKDMINSVDYESQILGLSLLKQSKTVRHYNTCQMFRICDLTNNSEYGFVCKNIDLMIEDIIHVLEEQKESIHTLTSHWQQIIVGGCKLSSLYKELNLWLEAHRL